MSLMPAGELKVLRTRLSLKLNDEFSYSMHGRPTWIDELELFGVKLHTTYGELSRKFCTIQGENF